MKFFINNSNDPCFNLALEELMLERAAGEIFMLWRNAPAVIFGYNQCPEAEINLEYARERDIKTVRRITGGGAVYHDLGNINFTYISQKVDKFGDFLSFSGHALDFLRSLGLDAEHLGKNDLGIGGRKISGAAEHVAGKNILHHGTLLFDTDFDALTKVLTPPKEKLESKGIKSVRSRVANISEYVNMSREEFWAEIRRYFANLTGNKNEDYEEIVRAREAETLAEKKYRTPEWNFGGSSEFGKND